MCIRDRAALSVTDRDGAIYELETDLKYDVIVRNENYIEDFFGFEDIHKKYPGITENRWQIISRGDLARQESASFQQRLL